MAKKKMEPLIVASKAKAILKKAGCNTAGDALDGEVEMRDLHIHVLDVVGEVARHQQSAILDGRVRRLVFDV